VHLRGSVCLVTGASGGIGGETARALASRGARVLAAGADRDRTQAVADAVGGAPLVSDLAHPGAAEQLASAAIAVHGRVDVLVNNAGVGWAGEFAAMPPDQILHLIQVDLAAALLLTRAVLPGMLDAARGHVVNVGSVAGHAGGRGEAVYAACKAGIAAFTEALRQEHSGSPIGFSLVVPGAVSTPFFDRRGVPYVRRFPRPVPPARVAEAIVDAIRRERPQVVVPPWLDVAMRVRGAAPEVYRPLADRFG
jgi:short-subunit dehydrogenase